MKIERFEDIEAWQLARELTLKVYRLTNAPGFTKDYGLKRQIQNAEVHGSRFRVEKIARRGLSITMNPEPVNAYDQQYITNAEFQDVYDHAARTRATIRRFIKYLLAYEQSQRKKGSAPADPLFNAPWPARGRLGQAGRQAGDVEETLNREP